MRCSQCQSEVDPDGKRCPSCGAEFTNGRSALGKVPAGVLGVVAGVVMFVLLIALGAGILSIIGVSTAVAIVVWLGAEYVV